MKQILRALTIVSLVVAGGAMAQADNANTRTPGKAVAKTEDAANKADCMASSTLDKGMPDISALDDGIQKANGSMDSLEERVEEFKNKFEKDVDVDLDADFKDAALPSSSGCK